MQKEEFLKYVNASMSERGATFLINELEGQVIYAKVMAQTVHIAAFLLKESLSKQNIQEIRRLVKINFVVLSTYKQNNLVGIILNPKNDKTLNKLNQLSTYIKSNNLEIQTHNILGDNEVDGYIDYEVENLGRKYFGLKLPVNLADYHNRVEVIKVEEENKEVNLSKAITMALVGSLIGAIPALVAMLAFDIMSFFLYMIIPFIAITFYKKANGPSKKIVVVLISFMTVFLSVGILLYGYNLIAIANDLTFAEMLTYEGVMAEIASNLVFAIAGAIFAIWVTWNKINFKPKAI